MKSQGLMLRIKAALGNGLNLRNKDEKICFKVYSGSLLMMVLALSSAVMGYAFSCNLR